MPYSAVRRAAAWICHLDLQPGNGWTNVPRAGRIEEFVRERTCCAGLPMSSLEIPTKTANATPDTPIVLGATWRAMLAVNICLMVALFIYKVGFSSPDLQYTQILADYHFGFMKRALIGAVVGLAFHEVPTWMPYAVGTISWLATLVCFALLFDKVFGLRRQLPLFIFMIASPLFLKNFIQTLGYYDIYGCLLVIIFLLVPARTALYVGSAAVAAAVLLLIHHLHLLLYIPTLTAVIAFRYYLVRSVTWIDLLLAATSLALLAAAFLFLQFAATPPVPIEQLEAYMNSRMVGPPLQGTIWVAIFYRTLDKELFDTWNIMSTNVARFPIYIALIALHWPLVQLWRSIARSLETALLRRAVVVAVVVISLGYVAIFAVVFDYSRWVASWATCMILLLHATRQLATARGAPPSSFDERRSRAVAWILTCVPRLGIVRPF